MKALDAIADIVLAYRPDGRTGRAVASLQIRSNDPVNPHLEVALLGAVDDGALTVPEPPVFSAPSGTFGEDFSLEVTAPTPGALVRFRRSWRVWR